MKVICNEKAKEMGLSIKEINRIPEAGEEIEVSEERYKVLAGANDFNTCFVKKKEEVVAGVREEPIETAKKEVKTEKAVKKTSRKKKEE